MHVLVKTMVLQFWITKMSTNFTVTFDKVNNFLGDFDFIKILYRIIQNHTKKTQSDMRKDFESLSELFDNI